jgi:hypothetical protein
MLEAMRKSITHKYVELGSLLRPGPSGVEFFSLKAQYGYRYGAGGYRRCASGGDVGGVCKIGTGTGVGLKFPPSSSEIISDSD